MLPISVLADTNASWLSETSGNWSTASLWSTNPNYPNNGTPANVNYDAYISATGGTAYTVTLNSNITVNSLTIGSANATLNDTGGTFQAGSINLNAGTYELNGGTLSGSTVNLAGGSFTAEQGTLSGVSVSGGDLNVLSSASLDVQNGLTITQHNLVLGSGSSTYFDGASQTLTALNVAPSSNFATLYVGGPHSNGSASLTIGSNSYLSGALEFNDYTGNGTLINNGSIIASSTAYPTDIAVNTFINNGVAQANGGGTLLLSATNLTNNGTLSVANSSALNFGGTFSTAGLGNLSADNTSTILISGTDNNAGATLAPSGGTWKLQGGTINGGTLNQSTQPLVISTGTLNAVSVTSADLQLPASNSLYIQNGVTVASKQLTVGSAANLYFVGTQELDNLTVSTTAPQATIYLGTSTTDPTPVTLNLGSPNSKATTISGPFEIYNRDNSANNTLNNYGTISATSTVNPTYIETTNFNNYGYAQAGNNGTLEIDSLQFINYGTLVLGTGSTLRFIASNFTEDGTLTTPGVVNAINSTVTFSSGAVHSSGTLTLAGTSTVNQSATSSNTLAGPLVVASATGDQGNYSLSAGTLSCQQSALVGETGSGTFTQTAGTTTITGDLSAGNTGTLTAGTGTGKINISGGTLYADTVLLGSTAGGSGAMTVSGTANVTVGGGAHVNDLTVNGGTFTVLNQTPPAGEDPELNRAIVGGYLTNGALNVGSTGFVSSPLLKLGITSGDTGTFTETGGTVMLSTLSVGNDGTLTSGSGTGVANVSGGTLYADTVLLGSTAGGSGAMTVSGTANVTVGGGAHVNDLTVDGGTFTVLNQTPPSGEDPELNRAVVGGYLTSGAFNVGSTGFVSTPYIKLGITSGFTGTFNQSGGDVAVGTLSVGCDTTTSSGSGIGQAMVSGGSLTIGKLQVGSSAGGVGTVNISSTANVDVTSSITVTSGSTFKMGAGTLTADNATVSLPSGNVTIGDGTSSAQLHLHNSSIADSGAGLTIAAHALFDGGSDGGTQNVGSALFSNTNLTLGASTSVLHMTVGGIASPGTTFDQISMTGGVFTVGGATLEILPLSNVVLNQPYPIVVASGGGSINYSNVFSNLTTDTSFGPSSVIYSVSYSSSAIDVTFSTPEPGSAALLAVSGMMFLRRRRRLR
jgi:fibronectin-binding autotransporter adhesin